MFSLCLILAFGLVFNAVQANSISLAMNVAFGIPDWVSGLALVVLSGLIIFGGIRGIARFAELVVPFMALAYILMALFVVAMNISELPGYSASSSSPPSVLSRPVPVRWATPSPRR